MAECLLSLLTLLPLTLPLATPEEARSHDGARSFDVNAEGDGVRVARPAVAPSGGRRSWARRPETHAFRRG